MRAYSIAQPWAWGIVAGGARIISLDMPPSRGQVIYASTFVGSQILIHASKAGTQGDFDEAARWMRRRRLASGERAAPGGAPRLPSRDELPRGALVAHATLADVVSISHRGHRHALGVTSSIVRCQACGARDLRRAGPCPSADPWARPGHVGLVLENVVALRVPFPILGTHQWFQVPGAALLVGGGS